MMPIYPQDLTPAFLSELVGELRPGLSVEAVDITKIRNYGEADNATSVSTSVQVAMNVRYKGPSEGLPTRLLAKMSIPDSVACSNPELDPLFRNEIAFYVRLRREISIETPMGLGGRFDESTKRYVLLMEDLSPRAPHINSMMDDDNVRVVESLLDTLAKLHAGYWESPRFKTDLAWVENQLDGSIEDMLDGSVHRHILKELEREKFKREFLQETGTSAERLFAEEKALKRHWSKYPETLLHGDAHFGNTYVMPDGTGGVLDWQLTARGFVMIDVGYLITTALSVERRRCEERKLLEYYRDRLTSYGVDNAPSIDTLWLEYRRAQVHGFYLGWLTAPRENYGWETMVMGNHRTKASYQDHDVGALNGQIS
jgi:hypothetical protein